MFRPWLFLLLAPIFCAQAAPAQTDAQAYLAQVRPSMLQRVTGDPPFRLHATFNYLGADAGDQPSAGTYDETWISPDDWRREIKVGDFQSNGKLYRLTPEGIASPAAGMLNSIIPSQQIPSPETKLTLQKIDLDGHAIVRVGETALPGKKIALPDNAWYFLADKNVLLMQTQGLRVVNFTRVGQLAGKNVLLDITVKLNNRVLLQFHTESMDSTTSAESAAALAVPDNAEPVKVAGPVSFSSAVMVGRKLGGMNPSYPMDAKVHHIQGTVVLQAVIGKDGQVLDLHAKSSPDASLTAAAMQAVRTWRYKPMLLEGEPVEVRTEIHVTFTFNQR
jgi:TonB family protein